MKEKEDKELKAEKVKDVKKEILDLIGKLPQRMRKKITLKDMTPPFGGEKYWEDFRMKIKELQKEFEFHPDLLKKWHNQCSANVGNKETVADIKTETKGKK